MSLSSASPWYMLLGYFLKLFFSGFKVISLSGVDIVSIAEVWVPATGKRIRLLGGNISISGAQSVLLEDNAAGTTVLQLPKLAANTPCQFNTWLGLTPLPVDHKLMATASGAALITGYLFGLEEDG